MSQHECGAPTVRGGGPCRVRTQNDRCPAHGGPLQPQPKRYRCTGRNRQGGVCLAKVPDLGGRCFYHPVEDRPELQAPARRYRCTGVSRRGGGPCHARIPDEGGRCRDHALEHADQAAAE